MSLPPSRFDWDAEVPALADLGRVHFVAIGGAGMSGVARLMLAGGLTVSGSDAQDSPVLQSLADAGATVWVGHDAAHVADADTVVVSSAIRDTNLELAAARTAGVRVLHRAQALAAAMGPRRAGQRVRRVAIAGANGKTTTSSMLTVALQASGADPSFALGGQLARAGTNAQLSAGTASSDADGVFVVEADESDGSFLVYHPDIAVVTSVQPDHLDYYGDLATVEEAYRAFVATLAPGGLLVVCVDDPGAAALVAPARELGLRVIGYGESPQAQLRLVDVVQKGSTGSAGLEYDGSSVQLSLTVPGRYNLQNAAAAYAVAVLGLAQDPDEVLAGLAGFEGTRRRFERRGDAAGVEVVDDYAHNPAKLAAVVATGRQLVNDAARDAARDGGAPGRLVVVFQPHLYSRTRDFAPEFGAALLPADVVVVMDVYAAREDPVPGVSAQLVVDAVFAAMGDAVGDAVAAHRPEVVLFEPTWDLVPPLLVDLLRSGDLLLTVGAGDVTAVGPQVLRGLAAREPAGQPVGGQS